MVERAFVERKRETLSSRVERERERDSSFCQATVLVRFGHALELAIIYVGSFLSCTVKF